MFQHSPSWRALISFLLMLLSACTQSEETLPGQVIQDAARLMSQRLISDREQIDSQPYYLEHLVHQLLLPSIDHTYMAKKVLSKYWKQASQDQRSSFVEAFKHRVIRTYAGAFKAFNGQEMQFSKPRYNKTGNKASVKSLIYRASAQAIRIDYKLYQKNQTWLAYDIVIEGVSLIKSFRDQLHQKIKSQGLAQTISSLATQYKDETPHLTIAGHNWGSYIGQHLPGGGLAVDLATEILTRAGYHVDMKFMPWKRINQELSTGKVDLTLAPWFEDQGGEAYLHSRPYVHNDFILIKHKAQSFDIDDLKDLRRSIQQHGYRLGIDDNRGYDEAARQLGPKATIRRYQHSNRLILDLANHKLDFALMERNSAQQRLYKLKHIKHLDTLPEPLIRCQLEIGVHRNHPTAENIIAAFNKTLRAMKKDGSYERILRRHKF